MTFIESYENILKDKSLWNPSKSFDVDCNLSNILNCQTKDAQNFITELLFSTSDTRDYIMKQFNIIHNLEYSRIIHTISLYLFGIKIASGLGFEKFDLPEWDRCLARNFIHYWLIISLCHDIGYSIEKNKSEYPLTAFPDIDSILSNFGLKHDLRRPETQSLLEGYYEYALKEREHIDHGIVGAFLLYNFLISRYERMDAMQDQGALMISEKPLFGKALEESAYKLSLNIARHNMWFATNSTESIYWKYGLGELIPSSGSCCKYQFSDNPIFFLLCLCDTLEPIKANNYDVEILYHTDLTVIKNNGHNGIKLFYDLEEKSAKYKEIFLNKLDGLESWVNIVRTNDPSLYLFT